MSESSSVSTFHITIPKTARVATAGKLTSKTKYVWIACHGYGEIASEFVTSMEDIVDEQTFVVAPEALSRFYWGGKFDGKAVASWMTREDRLNEINDYANYLSIALDDVLSRAASDVKVVLFGFSQGAATVMRWANAKSPKCDAIVIWSGMIPEDIDYDLDYYGDKKLYCRYGDQDRFITEERTAQHQSLIDKKGLSIQMELFIGKHKVYGEPLKALAEKVYQEI